MAKKKRIQYPLMPDLLRFCLRRSPRLSISSRFLPVSPAHLAVWVLLMGCQSWPRGAMKARRHQHERRQWTRLPLAIPVFVRSRGPKGREFLEFATALNVSAGGMLVAIRKVLPQPVSQLTLEIPSAPIASLARRSARSLRARALRTTPADGYYLLGLKFARPLPLSARTFPRTGKIASGV